MLGFQMIDSSSPQPKIFLIFGVDPPPSCWAKLAFPKVAIAVSIRYGDAVLYRWKEAA
jgi:hypothetical protein